MIAIGTQRKRMLSTLLSALGMGCAISWYNFAPLWLDLPGPTEDAEPLLAIPGNNFVIGIVLFALLAGLGILQRKTKATYARVTVLALGVTSTLVLTFLVMLAYQRLIPSFATVIPSDLITACLYALMLCFWSQCLADRSVKGSMTSLSGGLLIAATLSLPLVYGPTIPAFSKATFALLPFVFLTLAYLIMDERDPDVRDATHQSRRLFPQAQLVFSVKGRMIPIIPVYAALMGFATTQFYTINASTLSGTANLGTLLATGAIFLFVAFFIIDTLDIGWCLFLSGVVFCVATTLWLVLPQPGELVVVVTGSLHWASFLLLICASLGPTSRPRQQSTSSVCVSLALFYLATGLGMLTGGLGIESRAAVGTAAIVVLLGTFVFARRQGKLPHATGATPGPQTDRSAVIAQLAGEHELSPRETEVFSLLAEGNSLKRIANELVISENTVKRHRSNVYQKLMVNSRQELIDMTKDRMRGSRS